MSVYNDLKSTNTAYFPRKTVSGQQIITWDLQNVTPNVWDTMIDSIHAWLEDHNANGKALSGLGDLTFSSGKGIKSATSVGIGTAAPSRDLHINGSATVVGERITATGGYAVVELYSDISQWQFSTGGSASGMAGAFYIYDALNTRFMLRCRTNGNVFINAPTYASDAAAGAGGLAAGDIWKDSSGNLHIKL